MAVYGKKKPKNVTYGDAPSDKVGKWSSIPNASVGKDIAKSIGQVIRDGGVKGVSRNRQEGKNYGKRVTTKKGKSTFIRELISVKNSKNTKKKKNK